MNLAQLNWGPQRWERTFTELYRKFIVCGESHCDECKNPYVSLIFDSAALRCRKNGFPLAKIDHFIYLLEIKVTSPSIGGSSQVTCTTRSECLSHLVLVVVLIQANYGFQVFRGHQSFSYDWISLLRHTKYDILNFCCQFAFGSPQFWKLWVSNTLAVKLLTYSRHHRNESRSHSNTVLWFRDHCCRWSDL